MMEGGWLDEEEKGVDRTSVGNSGETIAVEYLRLSEYTILDRNYRVAGLEVDVVAAVVPFL